MGSLSDILTDSGNAVTCVSFPMFADGDNARPYWFYKNAGPYI